MGCVADQHRRLDGVLGPEGRVGGGTARSGASASSAARPRSAGWGSGPAAGGLPRGMRRRRRLGPLVFSARWSPRQQLQVCRNPYMFTTVSTLSPPSPRSALAARPEFGATDPRSLLVVLRAMAERTRLRMLALLTHGERAVSEIAGILGQSQPRVSRHLRVLAEAGLVERVAEGAWVFYRLREHPTLMAALAELPRDEVAADLERLRE
jgi:DNA-binding transcriptional ArsR family regulator